MQPSCTSGAVALLLGSLLPILATGAGEPQRNTTMTFTLTSTAFDHGGEIPSRYTCDGDDIAPPLAWSGLPEGTRSLVLIVDDPDAPDPNAPRMTWVHWVLYNIPARISGLTEGTTAESLPNGTGLGFNDWKRADYGGPCPPVGRHRYFHKLYALEVTLPDLGNPSKTKLLGAMDGHILGKAELVGVYERRPTPGQKQPGGR